MALRQLATGAGDGCSADAASGSGDASSSAGPSNPLGGLADALLGRPSKAHERAHEVRRASGGLERVRVGVSSRGLAVADRQSSSLSSSSALESPNLNLFLSKQKKNI